ncbi:MAG: sulfur oxidation c-type cytochrome SoxA [Betaproteobacteria bacterium]|nr:sulfur oxidation c-type cytochrome SoxA [Betaproteobacteria bacterium]
MKWKLACVIVGLLLGINVAASASPAEDRSALIKKYKETFPDIKFENYIYGALAMNPDAKSQYDEIMAFPPYSIDMGKGQKMWEKPFKNGKKFSSCFPNGGKNVAGNYPYFDNVTNRVVTFENAINACLRANGEKELKYGESEMGLLTAYAKSLSDGMKVNVKVEGAGALVAYEKGKAYYYTRGGQLNFACSSCHIDNAGKFIRSDQLSMMIGQASHWPEFRAGTDIVTLQKRFMQCNRNTRETPKEADSEEYNNLEYFLTYMSNGLPMQTPVFRK